MKPKNVILFAHYMRAGIGRIADISCVKPRPHCKSPGQIGGAAWPSGLVERIKNPGVDDKPSGFITWNEADWLRHPVQLNAGKCQRKAGRLRSLRYFSVSIFVTHSSSPPPCNLKFSKILDEDTISWIQGSCNCDGEKLSDKIADKKIENVSLIFLATIFITEPPTPHPPHRNHRRTSNLWY